MPNSFSSALKTAADNSKASGQIGAVEHATMLAVASDPHVASAAEAIAGYKLGLNPGAVNWLQLIQQLQTLIPFIMQLIALFTKPVTVPAPQSSAPSGSAPSGSATP